MTCRIHWCKEAESSLSVVLTIVERKEIQQPVDMTTHKIQRVCRISSIHLSGTSGGGHPYPGQPGRSFPVFTIQLPKHWKIISYLHALGQTAGRIGHPHPLGCWPTKPPSPQAPKPPKQRSAQRRVSKSTHASPTWTFTSRVAGRGFSSDAVSYAKTSKTKAFRKCNTSVGACFQHAKNMQWQYDRWSNYDLYHLVDWEVCKGYLLPTTRTYHYNVVFVKEHSPPTSTDAPQKPIPYSYIAMNFVGTPGFSCLDVPPRCEQDASIQAVLEWHGYPFQNRWSNSASRKAGKHIDMCT